MPQAPASAEELGAALAAAASSGLSVLPVGLRTRGPCGASPKRVDLTLSTRALTAVVAHDPADLTITVEAGLSLAALDSQLAAHGQWLPHQPYRGDGTVGGLLACGDEGALALQHGRARDDLVGVRVALADGTLARGRGRVVKNVAGFDLPRLLCGSHGTLGVIVEASFKLWPRPVASTTLATGFGSWKDAWRAAGLLLDSPARPSFVDLLAGGCAPQLLAGFDEREERVAGETARAQQLLQREGADSVHLLSSDEALAARRGLDDPARSLADEHHSVLAWAGRRSAMAHTATALRTHSPAARMHLRPGTGRAWFCVPRSEPVPALLELLRQSGHAVLCSGDDAHFADADQVWGPPPPDMELMLKLKRALDPGGTLATGRFVGGL